MILELTPYQTRENRSGRGPMRVFASDQDGNTISLIYFNNPGWAKRSLPMGEKRIVSGKLEAYGDEWQIIHPEIAEPGKGPAPAIREPVYPLTEGLTNRRMGDLAAAGAGAGARASRVDRVRSRQHANAGAAGVRRLRSFIVSPALGKRGSGSPMTRSSRTSLRLLLLAPVAAAPSNCSAAWNW